MHSKWFPSAPRNSFDRCCRRTEGELLSRKNEVVISTPSNRCTASCALTRHMHPYININEDDQSNLSINHFDYSKRLTAQSALSHPWLISSAFNTELHVTKTKLKRYVIKKRWIKAVNTIIALRRMGAKINVDLI